MLKATGAAISVVCPSCSTKYLLPRAKCPASSFTIECKRCQGTVPVDPTLVRAEKHVETDDVCIELEGQPDNDAWRVLINGKPVAMTFAEEVSTFTNAGVYHETPRPAGSVEWAPLGRAVTSDAPFEVERSDRGIHLRCEITGSKLEMNNTVVYDSERLAIDIPPDLSSAAVSFHRHTDTSS